MSGVQSGIGVSGTGISLKPPPGPGFVPEPPLPLELLPLLELLPELVPELLPLLELLPELLPVEEPPEELGPGEPVVELFVAEEFSVPLPGCLDDKPPPEPAPDPFD